MSKLLARWADFSKGDAGWTDKSRVQPGYFLGENVVPYRDGSIGPRSGILDLAVASGIPAGTLYDMGYEDQGNSGLEHLWVRKGTALARISVYDANGHVLTGQQFFATTGAFAAAANGDSAEYDPRTTLFCVYGDKCYACNWSVGTNGTLTAIAGSPGAACMEIFGDFLVVANLSAGPRHNRIQFSAASDYTTWPAGNFIDIGAIGGLAGGQSGITAMRRVKDQLLVWTESGHLYVITGTLGENEVIREFMVGDHMSAPAYSQSPARARDGSIWWTRREEVPNVTDQDYDFPSMVPVQYLGGQRTEKPEYGGYLKQLQLASNRSSQSLAVPGRTEGSIVLLDAANRALLYRLGAWSRHAWGTQTANTDHYRVCVGSRGDLYTMNAAGTKLLAWQFELERPPWKFSASATENLPYATKDFGAVPDVPAWFATPEFRTPDFQHMVVERVEVIYTSHETRDTQTNHFQARLQQYDAVKSRELVDPGAFPPDDDYGIIIGANKPVTVPLLFQNSYDCDDTPPTSGLDNRLRRTLYPDNSTASSGGVFSAPAIRVFVTEMRGVSVHEILVWGEMVPPPPP